MVAMDAFGLADQTSAPTCWRDKRRYTDRKKLA